MPARIPRYAARLCGTQHQPLPIAENGGEISLEVAPATYFIDASRDDAGDIADSLRYDGHYLRCRILCRLEASVIHSRCLSRHRSAITSRLPRLLLPEKAPAQGAPGISALGAEYSATVAEMIIHGRGRCLLYCAAIMRFIHLRSSGRQRDSA